jgi:hypothetical protein
MPNTYTRQALGRNRHLMSTKPGTSFSPRREHLWLSREVFFRRCTPASPPIPSIQRTRYFTKALLKAAAWAREELNLRPLPCQIQRASASMYVGRLNTGKDHRKAAGERTCNRSAAPTISHASLRVVLIPTAVGCCPSAARRTEAHRRDDSLLRSPLCPAARPFAVSSIPDAPSNMGSIGCIGGDLARPRPGPADRGAAAAVRAAARHRLGHHPGCAANVEPYLRADGTRIWSLMQLERLLRPAAYGRRRGGHLDRRRTRP